MPITIKQATTYGLNNTKTPIINNLTCSISNQSITLIVGKTGAGKSTLLHLLTGLVPLHQGSITFNEHSLWKRKRVQRQILLSTGVVFQYPEHQLFAQTVFKEFQYSLRPYHLTKEQLNQRMNTYQHVLFNSENIMQQSPFTLSGGQKRKIALTSTFATEPEWLFLDEPTAGMDFEGVKYLVDYIQACKNSGNGGVVIATHDLDTFLPIADVILVMENGKLLGQFTPAELWMHEKLLIEAGIGLPGSIEVSSTLSAIGIQVPSAVWSPEVLAEIIDNNIKSSSLKDANNKNIPRVEIVEKEKKLEIYKEKDGKISKSSNKAAQIDPRTKWIVYLILSFAFLLQQQWIGIALSGFITVFLIFIAAVDVGPVYKLIKPFLFFMLIASIFAGLEVSITVNPWTFTDISFSLSSFVITLKQLLRFLFIMLLGVLLTLTTSQIMMKHGLEKAFSLFKYVRFPTEVIALSASLVLRFIPLIFRELERFSLIAKARGKSSSKARGIHLRELHVITIPLLLSLFQLVEDVILAMEIRGYSMNDMHRTPSITLKFNKVDRRIIFTAILLFFVLLWIKYI